MARRLPRKKTHAAYDHPASAGEHELNDRLEGITDAAASSADIAVFDED